MVYSGMVLNFRINVKGDVAAPAALVRLRAAVAVQNEGVIAAVAVERQARREHRRVERERANTVTIVRDDVTPFVYHRFAMT